MFAIGDNVWAVTTYGNTRRYTCPDCLGTCRLRFILADDTEVSVACQTCKNGWNGPLGYLETIDHSPKVQLVTVEEVRQRAGQPVEYICRHFEHRYVFEEGRLFLTEKECAPVAAALAEQINAEQRDRDEGRHKVKDHKSWAWHVTYHRGQVREAQRKLEYHTAALNFAKSKAKEPAARSADHD